MVHTGTPAGQFAVILEAHEESVSMLLGLKRVVIGSPLETARQIHERLSKTTALAVFSSDAMSSSAYATEEILRHLALAGLLGIRWSRGRRSSGAISSIREG
jgi:hypothetical protein